MGLSNYSEFGLIVGALAASSSLGWIDPDWLLVFAIALSFSYVLAAPATLKSETIYYRLRAFLHRFETERLLADDKPPVLDDATILVVGMGQLGTTTYDHLSAQTDEKVLGMDFSPASAADHLAAGHQLRRW